MSKYFTKNYNELKYPICSDSSPGLRNAQIGAIHALASFNALKSKDTSIIVMPTGSGKTAVLMMAPYVLTKEKVLIVTPSKMVRGQITEDFQSLRTLCKAQVFPNTIKKPIVYEMTHKYNDQMISVLKKSDVIIATPNCALSLSESSWARENIDLVEIDEAHHVPATTWQQILINLKERCHVLFTATPFRLDRKEISGEIIFDYPLSQAYEDGIFGEIKFVPVDESGNKDLNIAKKAEEVLQNDRNEGYDHYLMVRTDSKKNATILETLYSEHTTLRLKKIDSSVAHSTIKRTIEQLYKGELDGIICVDMLGEGYDFPNLKIAAIHSPHKSLANTLQFIGRFARTNAVNIGTAKFIAVNDEELQIENTALYSKDSVWQDMIIGMSEGRNQKEIDDRKYYKEFLGKDTTILDNISLQAIKPNCHDKIYQVSDFDINGNFPDICNVANRVFRNKEDNTVVGIGVDYESPLWVGNGEKINLSYMLYIIHYQKETRLLHIYSPKHSESIYEELVLSFCSSYDQMPKAHMHRVLGNMEGFEIFNSGLLNMQSENGESYRILAGSDVSSVIDPDTGRLYAAGHAFCKATDKETQEESTIGYSSASKVWSSTYLELREYIQWLDKIGMKIINQNLKVKTNTNFDNLQQPLILETYPDNIFYCDYHGKTYSSTPHILLSTGTFVPLIDCQVKVLDIENDKKSIIIGISHELFATKVRCSTSGKYTSVDAAMSIKNGKRVITLHDYLTDNPLIFKTLDDATIQGIDYYPGNYEGDIFDKDLIEAINWKALGTDISLEFNKKGDTTSRSIQSVLQEILLADKRYKYVVYDHGSGEIADFITIYEEENKMVVSLYHVKKMSGKNYNAMIGDIYEVCGQAVKSITWFSVKGKLPQKIVQRHNGGNCVLLKGNYNQMLADLRSSDHFIRGEIVVVQPSVSKTSDMPGKYQEVLAATSTFIKRAGKVNQFRIMGSP
ncbi:DEAD/DEAH box helicase [uncultured Dubosiella sp.]|uniref:DEAD/DEAH box helicase n=6 Tax=uncultured Dubosiella sp. TaxID=1937011 RepID=UPI00208027CC|nr:DEAD/DEAH box helicase family protein [uncultured Dubosiella sp.]GJM57787.1 hypothetical protein EROP_14800 [Erysipelotrichaceae bacterium OPF54]